MKQLGNAAALLVLVALGIVTLWVGCNEHHYPDPPDSLGPRDVPSESGVQRVSDHNDSPRAAVQVPSSAADLWVVDASQDPLEEVQVRLWDPRPSLPELPEPLTSTDSTGHASVIAESREILSLGRPGFQTTLVSVDPGETYRVTMRPSSRVEVVCRDVRGTPIEGLSVFASRGSGLPQGHPGLDPRTAVYSAATDTQGRALIEGLSRGQYNLNVIPPDHLTICWSSIPSTNFNLVEVPGPPVEFVLGELHGAILTPPDDVVSFWHLTGSTGLGTEHTNTSFGWFEKQDELRKSNPSALVVVRQPRWSPEREFEAPSVTLKPFLQRRGWLQETKVTLTPISELQPRILDSPEPAPASPASGEIRVVMKDKGGEPIKLNRDARVAFYGEGDQGLELLTTAGAGATVALPLGPIEIGLQSHFYRPYLRSRVQATVTSSPQTVEWRMEYALHPVRWNVEMEGQVMLEREAFALTANHLEMKLRISGVRLFPADSPHFMASGLWEITAFRPGFDLITKQVDVAAGRETEVDLKFVLTERLR